MPFLERDHQCYFKIQIIKIQRPSIEHLNNLLPGTAGKAKRLGYKLWNNIIKMFLLRYELLPI